MALTVRKGFLEEGRLQAGLEGLACFGLGETWRGHPWRGVEMGNKLAETVTEDGGQRVE